jgi:hypothetical protein
MLRNNQELRENTPCQEIKQLKLKKKELNVQIFFLIQAN